jgi:hypothetical protein
MREGDDIGDHADVEGTGESGEEVFVHCGVGGEEVGGRSGGVEEFGEDGSDY